MTLVNAWPKGEETFTVFPIFNPIVITIGLIIIASVFLIIVLKKKK